MSNTEGPPVLKCEIVRALKKMKNAKAAGGGGEIPTEILKAIGDFGIDKFTLLLNEIYDTEEILSSTFINQPKNQKQMNAKFFARSALCPT